MPLLEGLLVKEEVSLCELGDALERKGPFSTVKQRWDIVQRSNGSRLGTGRRQGGPVFSAAAAPSIHATHVTGAPWGSTGRFRGPTFNGDQAFLSRTLCGSLSLCPRHCRGEIPPHIKQNVFILQKGTRLSRSGGTQPS